MDKDVQQAVPVAQESGIDRAKARRAERDASGELYVDHSIFVGIEACLTRNGKTVAHVVNYADAVEIAEKCAASSLLCKSGEGAGEIEQLAQFLHDEGGFGDAMTDRTWPEHDADTGQRGDGWVKIVPSDVVAKFRDAARRWLLPRLALTPDAAQTREAEEVERQDAQIAMGLIVDAATLGEAQSIAASFLEGAT